MDNFSDLVLFLYYFVFLSVAISSIFCWIPFSLGFSYCLGISSLFSLRFSWEFLSLGLLLVLGTVNLCFGDVHFFFAVFSSVCNFCLLVYRLLFCFLYAVSFCVSIKWWLNKGWVLMSWVSNRLRDLDNRYIQSLRNTSQKETSC